MAYFNNKKTALKDDAMIYQHNSAENMSLKEKWKTMTFKERAIFFKSYLLIPLIIILIVIGALSYSIFYITKNTWYTSYYIAGFGHYMDDDKMQEHAKELENMWGLGEKEHVIYSTDFSVVDDAGKSQVITQMAAGDIDVIVGNKDQLSQITDLLADYSDVLPEEIYNQIPESAWVYIDYSYQEDGDEIYREKKAGISVYSTVWKDSYSKYGGGVLSKLVICIPSGSETLSDDSGYFLDFIKYLFNIE